MLKHEISLKLSRYTSNSTAEHSLENADAEDR